MPKPIKQRATTNPIGLKFHAVMKAKKIEGDYRALAEAFKVKTPSVYDWIDHGRISKDRYPRLVEWSGRSLDWWFDVPGAADQPSGVRAIHEATPSFPLQNGNQIDLALGTLRRLLIGHNATRRQTCADILKRLALDPENDQLSADLALNLRPIPDQTNEAFAA